MFGRLATPFLWLSLFFLAVSSGFSSEVRARVEVDGHHFQSLSREEIKGIRAKGMADMLYERGEWSQAIRYYEIASRYIPREADIYFRMARIYDQRNLHSMALKYYLKAEEKYQLPENQRKSRENLHLNQVYMGLLLVKMGEDDKSYLDMAWKIYTDMRVFVRDLEHDYPEAYRVYRRFEQMLTLGYTEKRRELSTPRRVSP